MANSHEITALLQAWSRGDSEALTKLIPLVDRELRKIAASLCSNADVNSGGKVEAGLTDHVWDLDEVIDLI